MDVLKIVGGSELSGSVRIDGAKNSALPIMAAALAVSGTTRLESVPNLVDVRTMSALLKELGAEVEWEGGSETSSSAVAICSDNATGFRADWELMRRMRAGICVLGPLVARFGKAVVSLPGGCNIGHRPVDLHLKGLAALGAQVSIQQGFVIAECHRLRGAKIDLAGPSGSTVTGTCNVMVAAALASGTTVIQNSACEPEVVDLGQFLNGCGAEISGLGSSTLTIHGVDRMEARQRYRIFPDRIETATFAIAAAATRSRIDLLGCRLDHLASVLEMLRAMGVKVTQTTNGELHDLRIDGRGSLVAVDVIATPYPGIPSDTQAQLMALLTTISGRSQVSDTVFPDRMLHVSELMRMGAAIVRDGQQMIVKGGGPLTGAHVMASDLRASAALVIAALAATGETTIHRIYHLDRGYHQLEEKLRQLQANVQRQAET